MEIRSVALAAAVVLLTTCIAPTLLAQASAQPNPTARLIIKFRPTATTDPDGQRQAQSATQSAAASTDLARRLAERSGLPLRGARDLGNGMVGLALRATLAGSSLEDTLAALRADPEIEFAEVDRRRYARALPSDPLYPGQWYLQGMEPSATNFEAAWDMTTGTSDTVIAVLDTGIRFDHPDLAGRVLPGYDFVSGESTTSFAAANDGDGWDSDASDPGDWLSAGDLQSGPLADCPQADPSRSSWHGTRVAAMVGATTNNSAGIAGGMWNGFVLPVRVLGKCGGFDSDIVVGMRWAAGLAVVGVPTNPNPARILNLSLGGPDNCGSAYRNAVAELTSAGVLVVVSAGNDSGPVETPANCPGVLAVGGLRHVGTKVGYSSLGPEVGISAPAGNCPEGNGTVCAYKLVTADNTGQTVPVSASYTDDPNCNLPEPFFFCNVGTSFSAPIVSAVAGLMYGVNDGLSTAEFIARIKAGARPFPAPEAGLPTCPTLDPTTAQCNCTTSSCGAGIADAPGAIAEALRPMARIVVPDGTDIATGQNVVLDGSTSDAARGQTISSYSWTAVSGNPTFQDATDGPNVTVAVSAAGPVTVRLEITDDIGRTDRQEVTLEAAANSGGGGGGGTTHPLMLLTLSLLLARRRAFIDSPGPAT